VARRLGSRREKDGRGERRGTEGCEMTTLPTGTSFWDGILGRWVSVFVLPFLLYMAFWGLAGVKRNGRSPTPPGPPGWSERK
jgi:hypothetical protein